MRITVQQLNAHLFRKQGLERSDRGSVTGTLRDAFGVYGTAPTCYLSLLARLREFRFDELDRVVYGRRSAARIRCMRATLFLVPKRDLPAVFRATAEPGRRGFRQIVANYGVSDREYRTTTRRILKVVAGNPMTVSEIRKALGPLSKSTGAALNFIVAVACAEGKLVRARVRGGWRSDLFEYARFEEWLPDVDLESFAPRRARAVLAKRYFESYGPATADDFQWWAGLKRSEASEAVAAIRRQLAPVEVAGLQGEHLVRKKETDELASDARSARAVRLLPHWDGYLMAYRHRERYVPPRSADRVHDRGGNATSVVLAGGRVAGVWDLGLTEDRLEIKVALLDKAGASIWSEIKAEAQRIAEAAGTREVALLRCRSSRPLVAQGRLFSPLKDVGATRIP